ncbi:hypothetical protein LTR94_033062, partial [Friedmanniomyces endolithicus]
LGAAYRDPGDRYDGARRAGAARARSGRPARQAAGHHRYGPTGAGADRAAAPRDRRPRLWHADGRGSRATRPYPGQAGRRDRRRGRGFAGLLGYRSL